VPHVWTALHQRIERGKEVERGGDEHDVLATVEEFVEPVLRSATHPLVFKCRVVGFWCVLTGVFCEFRVAVNRLGVKPRGTRLVLSVEVTANHSTVAAFNETFWDDDLGVGDPSTAAGFAGGPNWDGAFWSSIAGIGRPRLVYVVGLGLCKVSTEWVLNFDHRSHCPERKKTH